MDKELARFKVEIDLADFAAAHGYALDEATLREGARSVRLASTRDKIIVARNASNGHWIYFTVLNDGDSGSVIDFLQNREGLTLGKVRQRLRRWLDGAAMPVGSQAARPRLNLNLQPLERDQAALLRAWALTRPVDRHGYLEDKRAIGRRMLASGRFAGRVRVDERGNAVFPHQDAAGEVCGWEIKNRGFTGFSSGGNKGLWLSRELEGDGRLMVAESAIDALSHATLWPDGGSRYASTGGGFGDRTGDVLRAAVARLPESGVVLLAFDNDAAGKQYAQTAGAALGESGRRVEVAFPPESVKDWNELLLTRHVR